MTTLNLYEAKNQFSKLVDAAEAGEVIVIARNGKPAAKLVPLDYGEKRAWHPDVLAFLAGAPEDAPDDAPLVDRGDVQQIPERDLF